LKSTSRKPSTVETLLATGIAPDVGDAPFVFVMEETKRTGLLETIGDEIAMQGALAAVEFSFKRFFTDSQSCRNFALRQVLDVAKQQCSPALRRNPGESRIEERDDFFVLDQEIEIFGFPGKGKDSVIVWHIDEVATVSSLVLAMPPVHVPGDTIEPSGQVGFAIRSALAAPGFEERFLGEVFGNRQITDPGAKCDQDATPMFGHQSGSRTGRIELGSRRVHGAGFLVIAEGQLYRDTMNCCHK
jgi:hypothetical protein